MGSHPTSIGKYRVDGVIGAGGMGAVYRAFDPVLEVPVAIKVIRGDADVKRFFVEARSTASMRQCPNIVTVYDFGEQDGNPYLVMEFLEGISLESIIKNRTPLSLSEKLKVLIDVLNGLSFAHERNIIHRDIKPANVIVLSDGAAKIVDFGIARIGDTGAGLTNTNTVMGTLEYMAPENFLGKKLDATADIWATGVILFQLLTGRSPFKLENESNPGPVIHRVINEPPPPLEEYIHDHLNEFKNILAKALAKNREERYQSAKEFALDVMQIQEQLKEEDAARYFKEGQEAALHEEWDRARELFNEAVRIDPQNTTFRRRLHEVTERLRVEQRKNQVEHLREEAKSQAASKHFDEAIALLNEAIHLDGTNQELQKLRAAVENDKKAQAKIASLLEEGRTAMQRGNLKDAQKAVQEVLAMSPEDAQARTLAGVIHKKIEEQERQDQLKKLIEQGRKQLSGGDLKGATASLEAARKIDANAPELSVLVDQLADAHSRAENESALNQLLKEIETAFAADDYPGVVAKATHGLEKFPGEQRLLDFKNLAEDATAESSKKQFLNEQVKAVNALLQQENFDEARNVVEQALAAHPGDNTLESLRLRVQEKAEQADQKTKVFTRAQLDAQRKRGPRGPERAAAAGPAAAHTGDTTPVRTAPKSADPALVSASAAAPKLAPVEPIKKPEARPVIAPAEEKKPIPIARKAYVPPPPPKSNVTMFIAIGAVVVLAIAAGLYFILGGTKTIDVQFDANPTGSEIAVDGQTCTAPCTLKLKAGNYSVNAKHDGYDPLDQPITVASNQKPVSLTLKPVAVTKPVEAKPAETGSLTIKANLDKFDVLVNNEQKGRSKGTSLNLTLPVGQQRIEVQKPGYDAEPQTVEIAKDSPQRLEFTLKQSASAQTYLSIATKRGARILVDGRFVGEATGDAFSYKVTPGNHNVRAELPGYKPFEGSVSAGAGETKQVAASLAAAPPSIASFAANPATIQQGQSAELVWQADGTDFSVEPGIGKVLGNNQRQVSPASTTTYTLSARNTEGQTVTRQLTLNVTPAPVAKPSIAQFESGSDSIQRGQSVKLIWDTQNANDVSIDQGVGGVSARGSRSVKPDKTTTYTLIAKGAGGSTTQAVTIAVEEAPKEVVAQPVTTTPQQNPEVKAILDLKDRYKDAYESMSVDAEREVWPGIPAERAKVDAETFKRFRAMRLRLDCGTPNISGDSATLSCTQTLTKTASSGKLENDPAVKIAISFKKAGGNWTFAGVRGQ